MAAQVRQAAVTDLELIGAHIKAAFGPCAHPEPVPVETLDGELVAWLCPGCDEQLPAAWKPSALPPFEPDPQLSLRVEE